MLTRLMYMACEPSNVMIASSSCDRKLGVDNPSLDGVPASNPGLRRTGNTGGRDVLMDILVVCLN